MEEQAIQAGSRVICTTNPEWGVGRCTLFSPSLNRAFIVYGKERGEGVPRFHTCMLAEVQNYLDESK